MSRSFSVAHGGVASSFARSDFRAAPTQRHHASPVEPSRAPTSPACPPVDPCPPAPRGRLRQRVHRPEHRPLHPLQHQLGDPVAAGQPQRVHRVVVDDDDLHLAAVAGVDRAGRVDQRHPAPGGQAGARVHERGVALRQREREPGRQHRALARRELGVDGGHHVGAGVAGQRVRRAAARPGRVAGPGPRRGGSRGTARVAQPAATGVAQGARAATQPGGTRRQRG